MVRARVYGLGRMIVSPSVTGLYATVHDIDLNCMHGNFECESHAREVLSVNFRHRGGF